MEERVVAWVDTRMSITAILALILVELTPSPRMEQCCAQATIAST